MAFKGAIKQGKMISIELRLDHSASGEAIVIAAVGIAGGGGPSGRALVAPGGMDTVKVKPTTTGTLEINVDLTDEDDTGQLIVRAGDTERHNEKITGDTRWTYSIT